MEIKELHTSTEMVTCIDTIRELYPDMTVTDYQERLEAMIGNGYAQVVVYDGNDCIAISGFWINTKLWCGKYLELDNVVVKPAYRSKGVGKLISEYLEKKALHANCNILVLDAYTHNFSAHRFYYNQGFGPKGFHFVKVLDEKGIR